MARRDPDRDQDEFPAEFHRNRREHGGASQRLNDDQLAELTEEERVAAGIDAYDPDEVPPATDTPPDPEDPRQDEVYEEERAELFREIDKGEFQAAPAPDSSASSVSRPSARGVAPGARPQILRSMATSLPRITASSPKTLVCAGFSGTSHT